MENSVEVQIASILEQADRMMAISEEGLTHCEDNGSLVLNGLLRECAYRLRYAAERERQSRKRIGGERPNQGCIETATF